MDVSISVLRAELSDWVDRARHGEDVVITERGLPVARLAGLDSAPLIQRLTASGVIGPPAGPDRPVAATTRRVRASGPVAGIVGEQRR